MIAHVSDSPRAGALLARVSAAAPAVPPCADGMDWSSWRWTTTSA
jgi:hypothetical protein